MLHILLVCVMLCGGWRTSLWFVYSRRLLLIELMCLYAVFTPCFAHCLECV